MINETLNVTSNVVGNIDFLSFVLTNMGAIISVSILFLLIGVPRIRIYLQFFKLRKYAKKLVKMNERGIMILAHKDPGILFGNMIDVSDLMKIDKALKKFGERDIDLILHTPGGELFASIKIANLLHNHKGEINAIIPHYAMSGGTFIALACDNIFMNNTSSLGSIDPQLGNLLKTYSAKAWSEIKKLKGKKADDETIAMNHLGKQATDMIINEIKKTSKIRDTKIIKKLTSGNVLHSYSFDKTLLRKIGLKIKDNKNEIYGKLIEFFPKNKTVYYMTEKGKSGGL